MFINKEAAEAIVAKANAVLIGDGAIDEDSKLVAGETVATFGTLSWADCTDASSMPVSGWVNEMGGWVATIEEAKFYSA